MAFGNDEDFREEILKFSVDGISKVHRETVITILIRILSAKLIKKKGKAGRHIHAKRSVVYMFFASLSQDEIKHFFNILFERFGLTVDSSEEEMETKLAQSSFLSYISFMFSFETIVK